MILLSFTLLIFISSIIADDPSTEWISIRIDEELPLFTVLFTTPSNITYRLFDSGRNQNSFVFYNASTGNLHLIHPLDREQLCAEHICSCHQCQLFIELIEWQWPYRLVKLKIILQDINDHSPNFPSTNYSIRLMENTFLGTELTLESANDADLDRNALLIYRLESIDNSTDDQPFELIKRNNGAIALKVKGNLDREEKDFYQYRLIASDQGEPARSNSTMLNIYIEVCDEGGEDHDQ